jgi:hypothetical protein
VDIMPDLDYGYPSSLSRHDELRLPVGVSGRALSHSHAMRTRANSASGRVIVRSHALATMAEETDLSDAAKEAFAEKKVGKCAYTYKYWELTFSCLKEASEFAQLERACCFEVICFMAIFAASWLAT